MTWKNSELKKWIKTRSCRCPWTLYSALKQKMKIDPNETGYALFEAFLDFMAKEMVDQHTANQDSS